MATFKTPFEIGEVVNIDAANGDSSLSARVIGFYFQEGRSQVEVGWVHNGDLKSAYVDIFRIFKRTPGL